MAFRLIENCGYGDLQYLYWENGRRVEIYTEYFGGDDPCVAITSSSLVRWMAPHHLEFISDEERGLILRRLRRRLAKQKTKLRIEPDSAQVERNRRQVLAWRDLPETAPESVLDEPKNALSDFGCLFRFLFLGVLVACVLPRCFDQTSIAVLPYSIFIVLLWPCYVLLPIFLTRPRR